MNGFLAMDHLAVLPNPERIVPPGTRASLCTAAPQQGGTLLTWGDSAGDIHCASRGDGRMLVLSGYILEIESAPDFPGPSHAADWLLQYLEQSTSVVRISHLLERIHGSFGIFYTNPATDVSLCLTDRSASRPLWTSWHGSHWIVSSHATAIALSRQAKQLDPGALGSLLLYGGPMEPRKSLFKSIESRPPGSITSLQPGGGCTVHFWYQFRHRPDEALPMQEWVELAAGRLLQSAARVVRECAAPTLFFSGGIDSRLTAAALKAASGNPRLVTLGDSKNLEVRVAGSAARALGLRHTVIFRDEHWYLRAIPGAVYEGGGTFLWTHSHFSQALPVITSEGGSTVCMLGDFCEAFSKLICDVERARGGTGPREAFPDALDYLHLPDYRPHNRDSLLSLLRAGPRQEAQSALRKDVLNRYDSLTAAANDPLIFVDHFLRWHSAATIATFSMFFDVRSAACERNLMFDKSVHELLEVLPSKARDGANLGARLIKRLCPEAAAVVNSNSLLPLCWPPLAHKFMKACKPVAGRLKRRILGDRHTTTGSWPKRSVLYGNDPVWRQQLEELILGENLIWADLLDIDAVSKCWRALCRGDLSLAPEVETLANLGMLARLLRRGAGRIEDVSTAVISGSASPQNPLGVRLTSLPA